MSWFAVVMELLILVNFDVPSLKDLCTFPSQHTRYAMGYSIQLTSA